MMLWCDHASFQYSRNLNCAFKQEAENEIQRLRESFGSEKSHCSEFENELKNLKSCCSCGMQTSAEAPIVEVGEPIDVHEVTPISILKSFEA